MKSVVLLALLFALTFSISTKNLTPEQKQLEQLKKKVSWAKVAVQMAELKVENKGALEDLAAAIQDVITSLNEKQERVDNEFNERTEQHNSYVAELTSDIDSANYDISYNQEFLDGVLYVQQASLNSNIERLDSEIEFLEGHIEEIQAQRKLDEQTYMTRSAEHQDAIEAISECLGLLDQILVEDGGLSLAQITTAKNQFERLKSKLGSNVDGAIVEALLSLATTEFADSSKTQQVVELLTQLRTNLINSLASLQEDEEKAIEDFNADMITSNNAINEAKLERVQNVNDLETCERQITEYEQLVADRKVDLATYESQLETENQSYEDAVNNYNNLTEVIAQETASCQEAYDLVSKAEFADYINNRAGQEVVVDQYHGDVTV